jgi:NAD(P)-dependent dehydrogenase (short-subunit alcohol dehydrogenase family)
MAVVLITGSNSGIGRAAALAFARNGDSVYASARDTSRLGDLLAAAGKESLRLRPLALDVAQPESFAAVVEGIAREAGRLDVLVNNAGMLRAGAFEDLPETTLRTVIETNLMGPLLLTRAVLPQMRRQHGGCIIMMSSLSGVAGLPGDVAYTASKFALEGATEALRHEVDRWGIRLALVEAGLYATGIFARNLQSDVALPPDYPANSPYRPLVSQRLREIRERLPEALDPQIIGDLMVRIAASDGKQLRWAADDLARRVLATVFAQDDAARDEFLRNVSGTDWWSQGRNAP